MKVSKEKIEELKSKHAEIFELKSGDKTCIVRKPTRSELAYAEVTSGGSQIKTAEIILKAIFLDGDKEILDNDKYFLGIILPLNKLIEIQEGAIKKL